MMGKNLSYLGWSISVVTFIIMESVNQILFKGVWHSTILIVFLITHAFYFRTAIEGKMKVRYGLFVFLFLIIIYFTLPKYTYYQAQELVKEEYKIILEADQKVIPVTGSRFFYIYKVKSKDDVIRVMVSPDTGKIIVLK